MGAESLAGAILDACGGTANVVAAEQCFTRLRLEVRALDGVDFAALDSLAEVRMALAQAGEVQLVLGVELSATVAAISALLG